MSDKEGFVNSSGTQIYYQERGIGDPLVLLMGFGADGNVWEKHAAVYEQHFRCIILDNRGVGKSDAPHGPYSTAMMADDTAAVMDHLGVTQAKVAGISMGGAIAQELALNHPERVSCLALISTWPSFNTYAKTVYENLKSIRKTAKPDDFMELLQLWIFAPPFYETGLADLKEGQEEAAANENPQTQQGFEGQLDACIHHNSVDRLGQIKVPTLITIGDMDIFTPPTFSELLHEKIPGSRLEHFPRGGHVHHWEDLERFNRITLEFLLSS
ncbi:MAG: alpha/beta fold hydrolase [Cyclobacteriaceae bacterium]